MKWARTITGAGLYTGRSHANSSFARIPHSPKEINSTHGRERSEEFQEQRVVNRGRSDYTHRIKDPKKCSRGSRAKIRTRENSWNPKRNRGTTEDSQILNVEATISAFGNSGETGIRRFGDADVFGAFSEIRRTFRQPETGSRVYEQRALFARAPGTTSGRIDVGRARATFAGRCISHDNDFSHGCHSSVTPLPPPVTSGRPFA